MYCMAGSVKGLFSARLGSEVLARLEQRKRQTAQSKSRLAERYIDEGLRLDEHPGIVFRNGPAGRRAALAAGPDVWEIVRFVSGIASGGERAIGDAARLLNLRVEQIRTALAYYSDYPQEIDERIHRDEETAERAEAAWHRQQAALS